MIKEKSLWPIFIQYGWTSWFIKVNAAYLGIPI